MAIDKETERERAYRFDLFIAPDWCERFDSLVAEHVALPTKGRLLEINSGTGSRVIAIAGTIEEGEVIGAEPNGERVAIARAKATAADEDRCSFVEADPERLAFEDASFDAVVVDTTLSEPSRLAPLAAEALRVARSGAPVAVKVLLRGSFDEFFSIYWEALHDVGLADRVWGDLERIVVEHPTFAEAMTSVESVGLREAESHRSKEEWRFETGAEFLDSPLVSDLFLDEWFSVVPDDRLAEVREAVRQVIDRESEGAYFDVSAKALVISGVK